MPRRALASGGPVAPSPVRPRPGGIARASQVMAGAGATNTPGPAAAAGNEKSAPRWFGPPAKHALCTAPARGRVRDHEQRGQRYDHSVSQIAAKSNPFFTDFRNILTNLDKARPGRAGHTMRAPPPRSAKKGRVAWPGLPGQTHAPARRGFNKNNERPAAPGSAARGGLRRGPRPRCRERFTIHTRDDHVAGVVAARCGPGG